MTSQSNSESNIIIPVDYLDFWIEILQVTQDSQGDPAIIFPLLRSNQDKLNEGFIYLFQYWVATILPTLTSEQAIMVASAIVDFSDLMQQFSPLNRAIAIAGYDAALAVFNPQTSPQAWVSSQINRAIAYRNHNQGNRLGNLEQSIMGYQNALQLLDQSSNSETWALVQSNLAAAYIDRLKGERAENLEQAIACCQNALKVYMPQENPLDRARVLNNMAVAYRTRIYGDRSENLEEALTCYQQALQIYIRKQFPKQWATTQSNLGNAYRNRLKGDLAENLEQAIICFEQALEVLTVADSPEDWARTQRFLGNAYRVRIRGNRGRNLDCAIAAFQTALQVYSPDAYLQDLALIQNDLALSYIQLFREKREEEADALEQAILCCNNALKVLTFATFPEQRARTLNTLGLVYEVRLQGDRSENLDQAIASYREALQFYTYETLPEQWARTHHNLGNALHEHTRSDCQDYLEQAISSYEQALQVYTPTLFPQNYAKTQWSMGATYWRLGRLSEAFAAFQAAIERVEFLRSGIISGDDVKQKLAEEWNELYQDMVNLCLERSMTQPHWTIQALEYVERSKARTLVELLSQEELLPKENLAPAVLQELQSLRRTLAAEERLLQMADAEDYTRFDQLRQQLNQFIEINIKPLDPAFSATQKVDAFSFSQMQALLNDSTVALVWYVTNQDGFVFVVTRQCDAPQVLRMKTEERDTLRDWINAYFQQYLQSKPNWLATLTERLQALTKILGLEQILEIIPENCTQLLLVPHRFLHLIPLHALPIENLEVTTQLSELPKLSLFNNTFLDRFLSGVSYTPSFQALQFAQNRYRPDFRRFLGVQNPTGDLSYADVEVSGIQDEIQTNVEILPGKMAQKNAIADALLEIHCVHFACHGYFNFDSPLKSALVLAGADSGETQEDGDDQTIAVAGQAISLEKCLTLGEIFGLNLEHCRLVTLSACETGLTDFRSLADEYIGLPSGFLYAGSPNVVSSLWSVNDISTALLMIKFYENLQNNESVTAALNQAQRWLRDSTGDELQQWKQSKNLLLNSTLQLQLTRQFRGGYKPFQNLVYWAAFYAIGQ